MRKAFRIVATIGLPIAAVLWCNFCVIPSPYLKRLAYPLDIRMDTTYTNFPGWICPVGHEGTGTQPITVDVHNRSPYQLVYHVTFDAWAGSYPNTQLCSEDIDVPSLGTGKSTCQVDFSKIETNDKEIYDRGVYVVAVSAGTDREYWELPSSEAPESYWELCVTLTEEDNLLARRYGVLAGIIGLVLLAWGIALLDKSRLFMGVMISLVLAIILLVLNFLVLPLIPYSGVAYVLELALIGPIIWWSYRRQVSFIESHNS